MSFAGILSGGEDTNFYAAGAYMNPSMTVDFQNLAAGVAGVSQVMQGLKRARTSTVTQTEDATGGGGPTGQFVRAKGSFGFNKSVQSLHRKLQRNDIVSTQLIWQRVIRWTNPWTDPVTSGDKGPSTVRALAIAYSQYDANIMNMPMYMWDLTSRSEQGSSQYSCHRMLDHGPASATPNVITFSDIPCTLKDGVTNTGKCWQPYRTTANSILNIAAEDKTVLKDVKVNFMFTGNPSAITRWYVDLVQILEDAILPTATTSSAIRTNFWRRYMRQHVSHPLATQPAEFGEGSRMKLLKRWEYKLNPDASINDARGPPSMMVELDLNFNRICNWDFDPSVVAQGTNQAAYENPAKFEPVTPDVTVSTQSFLRDPQARMYLILRCANAVEYVGGESAGNISDGWFPTFDARFIATHVQSDGSG